jgi:hypothetical protein
MQLHNVIAMYVFIAMAVCALVGLVKWLYWHLGPERIRQARLHPYRPW